MGASLRTATTQIPVSPEISTNATSIRQALKSAARQGARLINFFEGALSGYGKAQIISPERWRDFDWIDSKASFAPAGTSSAELSLDRCHHASTNRPDGSRGMIGPDGQWISRCSASSAAGLATAVLDRDDPACEIPLQ